MSQAPLENIDMTGEAGFGPDAGDDRHYTPLLAQSQTWRGGSDFVDSSGPIFSMYMEMAEEEDKKLAESWKADAEGILVFTGLFSASVASLLSVSIQDLQQNPQDTSNFYLANIYQLLADPNRSNISTSLPTSPPPFSPPSFAVCVNGLWFLSLVISITCALLATLLQQWARRYLKATQTRSSLHKRARIRAFYSEGVKHSHISMMVEALPALIHLSVSLFFAGLVVFLWNVNLTIFKLVLSWISVCTAIYGCISFIPVFCHNSPYYSPLTPLVQIFVLVLTFGFIIPFVALYAVVLIPYLFWKCCSGPTYLLGYLYNWFTRPLKLASTTPEEAILKSSSEIDTCAFTWTFDSLDEDHELDRFFAGLPGFHNSRVLKQPLHGLDGQQKLRILEAAIRLMDRTLSSNLLPDQVKRQRADSCTKVIDLLVTPGDFPQIVHKLISEDQYGPVLSTEIVDFVRRLGERKGDDTTLVQAMLSIIVARVQLHDDAWFNLASKELDIPESQLREYAAHGDSLSLAMLIYVTRQQFIHFQSPYSWPPRWPVKPIRELLKTASKNFNAQDTLPELQHEFCALWNEIFQEGQRGSSELAREIPDYILRAIRKPYIALHQGTNSAPTRFSHATEDDDEILTHQSTYLPCNVPDHVNNRSAFTPFPPTVPLSPASLDSPVAPPFALLVPFHVDESLTTVPPHDMHDNSQPTRQTTQSFCVPVTSPDPASAGAMRNPVFKAQESREQELVIVTPAPQSAPEASPIRYPPSASVPPVAVIRPNVIPLTPPVPQTLPTPASSAPALDNALLTATARDPPSANRAIHTNTATTLDPQAPPPLVTDSDEAIPGSSLQELDNGQTGGSSTFTSPV